MKALFHLGCILNEFLSDIDTLLFDSNLLYSSSIILKFVTYLPANPPRDSQYNL